MPQTVDTGFPSYELQRRNQQFLDALEHFDEVVQNRQLARQSVYRSMFPRGPFMLGEGLVKKAYRFRPGIADQRGLHRWRPVQISQKASGGNPGIDACQYNPYKLTYGFDVVDYTGFQTERSTDPICIRDLRTTWQFQQQLGLIFGWLADVTNDVWENYAREQYINFAVNEGGNGYVIGSGAPNTVKFAYDPWSADADGDNIITFATGSEISTLNWDAMEWFNRYLSLQVPMGAIGQANGMPLFGMVIDLQDWNKMVQADAGLREDFRYAAPTVLIENYGNVTSFKGYTMMHDVFAPRFVIKSATTATTTLKRVDPWLETSASVSGYRVDVNPAYLNAPFALGVIKIRDVFRIEVPPAGPASPGGGTSFGATPSLNGEMRWINEFDMETNLLRENGFYFGRYEAFAKPLVHDEEAIVFLYRRCPQVVKTTCAINQVTTAIAAGANNDVVANAAAADIDTTNNTIELTLAGNFAAGMGDAVTISDDDAATATAIIADDSAAPTYLFAVTAWGSASQLHTKYTAAGGSKVVAS